MPSPVENTPIEDHDNGSCLYANGEENPLDHVIPLELVVFAVEAATGLNDFKLVHISFKTQIIVVLPATKVGFAIVCSSGQGSVEQVYVEHNECPVSEKDKKSIRKCNSSRNQPSIEIEGHYPAVD